MQILKIRHGQCLRARVPRTGYFFFQTGRLSSDRYTYILQVYIHPTGIQKSNIYTYLDIQFGFMKWAIKDLDIQFGFMKWAIKDLNIQFIFIK